MLRVLVAAATKIMVHILGGVAPLVRELLWTVNEMSEGATERSAEVRDALAVVQTSIYLIRKQLSDGDRVNLYLEKHLSRIEESVERATRALAEQ